MEKDGNMNYVSKILSEVRESGGKKKGCIKIRDQLMVNNETYVDRYNIEKL